MESTNETDLAIPVADPTACLCNADVSERINSAQLQASRSKTLFVPKNKISVAAKTYHHPAVVSTQTFDPSRRVNPEGEPVASVIGTVGPC